MSSFSNSHCVNTHRPVDDLVVSSIAFLTENRRMKISTLLTFLAAACIAATASAHHSFAMFDNEKEITLEGTIKEFQWTNPHTWTQVMVTDANGKEVEWSIEGGSPNGLSRRGWKRTSIKPGDKATVTIHPLIDGSPGGSMVKIMINGELVGAPR